jgi:hypothetical protein
MSISSVPLELILYFFMSAFGIMSPATTLYIVVFDGD